MLKEGGREDRTSWTMSYFDVSCVSYFVQRGRKGGQNIMDFVHYFDVSCMNYFVVQRRREGGQNITDFELL